MKKNNIKSDKKIRVLYLMHIDWRWIFQRPQVIELLLEKDFNVKVVFPSALIKKSYLQNASIMPKNFKKSLVLPKQNLIGFIRKINELIYKFSIGNLKQYDMIWIGFPELAKYIPDSYCGKVIYDCMDNHVSMAHDKKKKEIANLEKKLINRADLIFVTSNKLLEQINTLFNVGEKSVLVRNGYSNCEVKQIKEKKINDHYTIGYFGTLSTWFDYELIQNATKRFDNITYHLIGPCEVQFEEATGVVFDGTVEHNNLFNHIKDYDCLIMPFKLNDIILAVDPVKLYEYICFGKCIISVRYPEIERFSDFVYFYSTEEEYYELLNFLILQGFPPKYTKKQQIDFLKENTWDYRYTLMKHEINNRLFSLN